MVCLPVSASPPRSSPRSSPRALCARKERLLRSLSLSSFSSRRPVGAAAAAAAAATATSVSVQPRHRSCQPSFFLSVSSVLEERLFLAVLKILALRYFFLLLLLLHLLPVFHFFTSPHLSLSSSLVSACQRPECATSTTDSTTAFLAAAATADLEDVLLWWYSCWLAS